MRQVASAKWLYFGTPTPSACELVRAMTAMTADQHRWWPISFFSVPLFSVLSKAIQRLLVSFHFFFLLNHRPTRSNEALVHDDISLKSLFRVLVTRRMIVNGQRAKPLGHVLVQLFAHSA